ncbi:MAG: hypothetical protein KBC43_01445 [Bacteroidales bacterium]|jgi:fumarate reductase subunit C|nr:hypothetical protein [Bacteroidales bacterium]MDX9905088.1 hypothetical protein [Bacteroidales bacterium]
MNAIWFSILFTAWYILALVVAEKVGKKRRIGEEWSFFLSFMFSPLVGLVVSLLTKEKD